MFINFSTTLSLNKSKDKIKRRMKQTMENKKTKKIKGVAKKLTLSILSAVTIVGILGAFLTDRFNMSGYADFIRALSVFYIPLIASIGYNSSVDKKKAIDVDCVEKEKGKN